MTPADMLAAVGHALYGPRWPKPLADAIGKHNRQIWRYKNGESTPDDELWSAVLTLLSRRQIELNGAADKLERWLSDQ